MPTIDGESLFYLRGVYCRFEGFRRAIIEASLPKGSLRQEVARDRSLFFDRIVMDECGRRLKEGLIKIEGGKDEVLAEHAFNLKEGYRVIYRIIRLKGLPSRVSYHSMDGKSRLCWRRCNRQEAPEEWVEGKLYGEVSRYLFKVLARRGIIPDYMIPSIKVEAPLQAKHIRRLERFIVEKYMKKSGEEALTQPGAHVEVDGTFLRLYFEASEKKVLRESEELSGRLQIVKVGDVLGAIIRLEPDLNLVWRVKEWPHGILRGKINLKGLKILSELGMLGPETKLVFNPIVRPRAEEVEQVEDQSQAGGQAAGE